MIRLIHASEVELIRSVAYQTWPSTFASILTPVQIDYMLNWMYNADSLEQQMHEGHQFFGFFEGDTLLGFIGVEDHARSDAFKIHKLYVLPACQGKQIGKKLIQYVVQLFPDRGVFLNVNRYNSAVQFYQKLGFSIEKEEDIPIGNDFWMNDYVMVMPAWSKRQAMSSQYRHTENDLSDNV